MGSEEPSDLQELIDRAQGGDAGAVERLLASHLPDLDRFLRHHKDARTLARESHADIVQSVCREVLTGLGDFDYRGPNSFRNWLFQAALNKVVDKHRYHVAHKRDAGREAPQTEAGVPARLAGVRADDATPSEVASTSEDAARLEAALAALPAEYREVILLARFQELPHEEIARRMDRTVEGSRALLRRALIRLAAELGDESGG